MIYCPNCGLANRDNSRFCNECGQRLGEWIDCPQCGCQNLSTARFCNQCGSRVEARAPAHSLASAVPTQEECQEESPLEADAPRTDQLLSNLEGPVTSVLFPEPPPVELPAVHHVSPTFEPSIVESAAELPPNNATADSRPEAIPPDTALPAALPAFVMKLDQPIAVATPEQVAPAQPADIDSAADHAAIAEVKCQAPTDSARKQLPFVPPAAIPTESTDVTATSESAQVADAAPAGTPRTFAVLVPEDDLRQADPPLPLYPVAAVPSDPGARPAANRTSPAVSPQYPEPSLQRHAAPTRPISTTVQTGESAPSILGLPPSQPPVNARTPLHTPMGAVAIAPNRSGSSGLLGRAIVTPSAFGEFRESGDLFARIVTGVQPVSVPGKSELRGQKPGLRRLKSGLGRLANTTSRAQPARTGPSPRTMRISLLVLLAVAVLAVISMAVGILPMAPAHP